MTKILHLEQKEMCPKKIAINGELTMDKMRLIPIKKIYCLTALLIMNFWLFDCWFYCKKLRYMCWFVGNMMTSCQLDCIHGAHATKTTKEINLGFYCAFEL